MPWLWLSPTPPSPLAILNQKAIQTKARLPARLQDGGDCVGSSDEKAPGQVPDRAPKCLTQQLCMLTFRAYSCYTAASPATITGSIRSIRRVQASPAGTPHRHAQTCQERFSGVTWSPLSRLSVFGGSSGCSASALADHGRIWPARAQGLSAGSLCRCHSALSTHCIFS